MQVRGPDGREWTVRRRWIPRWQGRGWERVRRKRRERERSGGGDGGGGNWLDLFNLFDGDDPISLVIGGIVAIIAIVLLAIWGLPVLLALLDLVVVLLLALVGVVGRVVFRRPWSVEATAGDEVHTRPVVGWFASRRAIERLADDIRSGLPFVPTDSR